ncbi:MAG: heavy-metal-associated domain-containing protein [Actinobacteria bacterium]|nr:heavy-metal-associated domain-containing protein [Actinomycetota bacterium]
MPQTTVFTVTGMTCGHCVAAVESEVGALPGVRGAHADLATGRLEVTSDAPVDPAAVAAAVEEAGYEVAS